MNRPIIDYNTTDVRIIKHNALRAALRGDDAMMNCTTYIDTHAGPGCHNNCPGSPMIASDHFNELFLYENNPEDFNKLKRNMRAGCILREADGFKSYCYSDKKTFVFMDPPFKSIRDYFKVANYLQTVSGIGALMLMYPVNTFFPIEDFHCMLQRQIGGVNFLIKKARVSETKYYCMFSSDVSVIPAWKDILNHSSLIDTYSMQNHIGDYLFKKRKQN